MLTKMYDSSRNPKNFKMSVPLKTYDIKSAEKLSRFILFLIGNIHLAIT